MARTMEIKLVLSGMQQASAGMRQISDQTRDLNRTRILPRVMPADQAKTLQMPAPRFLKGPEQRLQEIAQQRARLPQVADPGKREAIGKDLDRAEFLAKRSIVLHQRMDNPEESLNRPGLLELFGEMNGLLKAMTQGNPAAVVHQLARGIKLLSATGGLNIQQKLARANLPIPANGGGLPTPTLPPVSGQTAGGAGQLGSMAARAARVFGSVAGKGGLLAIVLAALVVAVTAAVVVYKTFIEAIKTAADALSKFKDDTAITGGNEKSTAFLGQLGLDPKTAMGFRASLDDPTAYGAAASVGVRTGGPMPYGRMDSGKMLEQFIRGVSKIEDPMQRLRKVTAVGHPELIKQVELYRRHGKTIDKDTGLKTRLLGDKESQLAAGDFVFQLGRVQEAFGEIMTALGKPFLRDAATWTEWLADALKGLASYLNENGKAIKDTVSAFYPLFEIFRRIPQVVANFPKLPAMIHDAFVGAIKNVVSFVQKHFPVVAEVFSNVFNAVLGFIKGIAMAIAGVMGGPKAQADLEKQFKSAEQQFQKWLEPMLKSDSENRLAKAIDENTKATQDLTVALPSGTHGGGERARGAIPSHLKGILLERAIMGNALRLGAFNP